MGYTTPRKERKCLVSPAKRRYPNERAAAIASRQIEFDSGKRLIYYYCAGCIGWHLTSRST